MATDRDKALKRAEERTKERAKRLGYDDKRAGRMAREAVEKADVQKKKHGHEGW